MAMPQIQNQFLSDVNKTSNPANSTQAQDGVLDFSNITPSYSYSASGSGLGDTAFNAYKPLLGTGAGSMPDLIGNWGKQAMSQYKTTQNDIINAMNQVANQRSAAGIMGGTESQNLLSNVMANLAKTTADKQGDVLTDVMGLRAQSMPQLLSLGQRSDSFNFNTSPDDYRIIADMVQSGFTG